MIINTNNDDTNNDDTNNDDTNNDDTNNVEASDNETMNDETTNEETTNDETANIPINNDMENDPIYTNEENMQYELLNSYINFVDHTNTSLHSMIEIINNQQRSFNQILSRHVHPTPLTSRSNASYRTIFENQYNRPINTPIYNHVRSSAYNSALNSAYSRINNRPYSFRPTPSHSLRQAFNRPPISNQRPTPITNMNNIVDYILYTAATPNENTTTSENTTHEQPTPTQIINAVEITNFSNINDPINHSCPISHMDFSNNDRVIMIKNCRHIFSVGSILRWFERNVQCPLCRYDITTDTSNNINESTSSSESQLPVNSPSSTPLPFAQQIATLISDQLTRDTDFSGNISIELEVPPQ
jgi:hypothetical protein